MPTFFVFTFVCLLLTIYIYIHRLYTYDTETRTMDNYVNHYLDLQEISDNGEQQQKESGSQPELGSDRSARNSKFSSAFRRKEGTTTTRLRRRREEPPLPVDHEHDDFTEVVPAVESSTEKGGVTNLEGNTPTTTGTQFNRNILA